jgi:CHAT domain-containing protein
MLFPWELVIPWRNVAGRRDMLAPLGTAHVIGRWRPGLRIKPEPQRYPLRKIAIINPDYPPHMALPQSKLEAEELQQAFGAICEIISPSDLNGVTVNVLQKNDIQLVHFTGHANFEKANANQSFLELENGEQLTAAGLGVGAITAAAPVIVLNACSVGDSGMIASRAGGFADRCLQTGCSAVLAAYWPISDGAARGFSLAFYDKLRRGRSFGEALQELRLDHEDDPTYHAYTFFGDPLARIVV